MDLSRFAYTPEVEKVENKGPVKEVVIKPLVEGQLPVLLEPGLVCVFVGFNPGVESAKQGHYYAHRSNRFWKVIYKCGLVTRPVVFTDDQRLQKEYRYGFTDLVARSTKGINQLSRLEMREGAFELETRIANVRPVYVCLVGKGIWQAIAKALNWPLSGFQYGLQPQTFGHAKLFVVPSTSGLVSMNFGVQVELWRDLAELVKEARASDLHPADDADADHADADHADADATGTTPAPSRTSQPSPR